jgi:predicted Rdx family selenoprotein
MTLIVLVIYCEWFEQILRIAWEIQSVFESFVKVGIEFDLVDHVGLVYD